MAGGIRAKALVATSVERSGGTVQRRFSGTRGPVQRWRTIADLPLDPARHAEAPLERGLLPRPRLHGRARSSDAGCRGAPLEFIHRQPRAASPAGARANRRAIRDQGMERRLRLVLEHLTAADPGTVDGRDSGAGAVTRCYWRRKD